MKKVYYVAIHRSPDFMNPTILEKFDNSDDAGTYAALMSRTRQTRYVILEQIEEWDGTSEEK